jgi:hypothetical protein
MRRTAIRIIITVVLSVIALSSGECANKSTPKLGPEVQINGFGLQLPEGFEPATRNTTVGEMVVFRKLRPYSTPPALIAFLVVAPGGDVVDHNSLDAGIKAGTRSLASRLRSLTTTKPEAGAFNGMECERVYYGGIMGAGGRDFVVHGCVYAFRADRKFVILMSQDTDPYSADSFDSFYASFCTLRRLNK